MGKYNLAFKVGIQSQEQLFHKTSSAFSTINSPHLPWVANPCLLIQRGEETDLPWERSLRTDPLHEAPA